MSTIKGLLNFDLRSIPFSRYGSYLAFSELGAIETHPAGLFLRTIHGDGAHHALARIELLQDGNPMPFSVFASPASLRLQAANGLAEFCFDGLNVVRLRTHNISVRLILAARMYDYAFPVGEGRWQLNCASSSLQLMLTPLAGQMEVDAPWNVVNAERMIVILQPDSAGAGEVAIETFFSSWEPRTYPTPFAGCVAAVEQEFRQWLAAVPALPAEYAPARELAAYVNWASVVAPAGYLKRPAMLMSKNWMCNVWSWDHCFNALALADQDPALAWAQMMIPFDAQNEQGALPDLVSDGGQIWSFCKPPVHGWFLRLMMERADWVTPQYLAEIYNPLCRWTNWWFTYRDSDGDGLPQYNHGNDSGWDNATPFRAGLPLEGPDLAAFLVLQMDTLAEIAARLGKSSDAGGWKQRSADLLTRLIQHSWRGTGFVAPRSGDHQVFAGGDSLFMLLPLLLGEKLPADMRSLLLAGLQQPGRFLTPHGLATESVSSSLYDPDGYWRGPIWAPSTLIFVEALRSIGQHTLANDLARSFCDMVSSSGCMAENYNALTGKPLRDKAYTWTSSTFLLLGQSLASEIPTS
jgi:putative isomerase